MIEPGVKYARQIPSGLRFDSRAQFLAPDFLPGHIPQNAPDSTMKSFFARDIFQRKQEKSRLVRFGGELRTAVTYWRAEAGLLIGGGTHTIKRSDQPRNSLLASGYVSSRFRCVKCCKNRHPSAQKEFRFRPGPHMPAEPGTRELIVG